MIMKGAVTMICEEQNLDFNCDDDEDDGVMLKGVLANPVTTDYSQTQPQHHAP